MSNYHSPHSNDRRLIPQRELVEAAASAAAAQATAAVMNHLVNHDCLSPELRAWIVRSIAAEKCAEEAKAKRREDREYWIKSVTGLSALIGLGVFLFHLLGRIGIWAFDVLIHSGQNG